MGKTVTVSDNLQTDYQYKLTEPEGKNFDPEFMPDLTPAEMLELGVFGAHYFEDYYNELPKAWLKNAKISSVHDPSLNYFGVDASQTRAEWQRKRWMYQDDPRGWFQWYCRYYLGRRLTQEDERQIKRWKAVQRHIAQVKTHCRVGDELCRPRQRQALLHWAYDSRKI